MRTVLTTDDEGGGRCAPRPNITRALAVHAERSVSHRCHVRRNAERLQHGMERLLVQDAMRRVRHEDAFNRLLRFRLRCMRGDRSNDSLLYPKHRWIALQHVWSIPVHV